ncbi:MAG: YesL family protein [Bacillus sp. (in: Bacteria)]|nr:YesL family protein [Bacillus sp. (in: firmicutes)]
MTIINSFLYKLCEWIMRFAYLNLLWIAFTLLGFIVAGIFPATVAMFTVTRKWVMKETEIPIFHSYFQAFKREWLKSNIVGGIFVSIVAFIYLEFTIINKYNYVLLQFSKYPLLLLVILCSLMVLYVFPTYVHYQVNLLKVLKNSLFISLVNPFWTTVMVLSLILIYSLIRILPSLLFIFGASVSSFVLMWASYQAFLNVQIKQEKQKSAVEN